jgi:hypothetical protein
MHLIQPQLHSRRAFLQRSAQLAATGVALPTALNLAAMGEAAAFNATDYKALVCVFLYGGNDYANTVVTYDTASYNEYAKIRGGVGDVGGGIALPRVKTFKADGIGITESNHCIGEQPPVRSESFNGWLSGLVQ